MLADETNLINQLNNGWYPLRYAGAGGHVDVLKQLIELPYGQRPDWRACILLLQSEHWSANDEGKALQLVAFAVNLAPVDVLVQNGANPESMTGTMWSRGHCAWGTP